MNYDWTLKGYVETLTGVSEILAPGESGGRLRPAVQFSLSPVGRLVPPVADVRRCRVELGR